MLLLLLSVSVYLLLTQWSFSPFRKLRVVEALPFDAPQAFLFEYLPKAESILPEEDFRQSNYWISVLDHLGVLRLEEREKLLIWPSGKEEFNRQLFIYDLSGIDLPEEEWLPQKVQRTFYKRHEIFHLQDQNGQEVVLSSFRNLLLLSHQSVFIEDALRELTDQNQSVDRNIAHPASWTSKAKHSFATTYYHFPFAASFFEESTQQGLSYMSPLTWEGWQIHWERENTSAVFTAEVFWANEQSLPISKQTGLRMGAALELIPAWAVDWEILQLKDIQEANRTLTAGRADWLSRYILPWAGDHLGWIDLMPTADAFSLAWLVPYQDSLLAQQSLQEFLEEAGELDREIYQTFELVQVNAQNLFGAWRKGEELVQNPWWCRLANYYVFAADQQGLRQLIDAYIVGQNILQHNLPDQLIQLETQWLRGLPCPASWQNIFPPHTTGMWLSGKATRKGWQVEGFPANPSAGIPRGPTILWRAELRGELDLTPAFISYSDGGWRAIATDRSQGVYQFDEDGDLRWRKEFRGKRISEIYPLARQGNPASTILFNSNEALYQLDEQGEAVENFPITLQPAASTGVLAIDFQQEGIYEFYVPCQNGIYAFSEKGIPLPDWNPLLTSGDFLQPLQHLQTKTEDYLIGFNSAGVLYNWRRSGEAHFLPKQLGVTDNPLGIESEQEPFRVAVVDKRGLAQLVNMRGEQFGLPLAVGEDSTVQFNSGNFIGDARIDFVTLRADGIRLHYYSERGFESGFHQKLDLRPDLLFTVPIAGQPNDLIGTLHRGKKEIRLYDGAGRMLPGFPLAGSTPFILHPLDTQGNFVLLVGHRNWLLAYQIDL